MPAFDVVSFPDSDHPRPGETAPDFTRPLVTDEGWEDVALSDLASSGPVLLFFYPLNWGGKSMYWWKEIQSRGWGDGIDAGDAHVTVVGIGISQPFDHQRFIEARGMDYGLFSDPSNVVAERFDIVHDLDGMTGIAEPRPAVFLLDESLTIAYAWVAGEWPETPPYDEIEAELERI